MDLCDRYWLTRIALIRLLVGLHCESYDDRYWPSYRAVSARSCDLSPFAVSNRSIRTRQRSNRPHFPAVLAERRPELSRSVNDALRIYFDHPSCERAAGP